MITPRGRHLGGRKPVHDPRDHHYPAKIGRPLIGAPEAPRFVDLRSKAPPIWDQLTIGSCTAHGWGRRLAHMYPGFMPARLAMYDFCRLSEGTSLTIDSGCQTRDMGKIAQGGIYDEKYWAYDVSKLAVAPPPLTVGPLFKIGGYSTITTPDEFIDSLASGDPVVFSFDVPAFFDDDEIEAHGIMRKTTSADSFIGWHDVCAEGYDMDFVNNPDFKNSGLAPALVMDDPSDVMVLVANSWGIDWGLKGYFWIALKYILASATGGDAWAAHPPVTELTGSFIGGGQS